MISLSKLLLTEALTPERWEVIKSAMLSNPSEAEVRKLKNEVLQSISSFIRGEAQKFSLTYKMPIDDFYQEGLIGASQAFDRFDFTSPNKFLTFAGQYIKNKMIDFANEQKTGGIHIPQYKKGEEDMPRAVRASKLAGDDNEMDYMANVAGTDDVSGKVSLEDTEIWESLYNKLARLANNEWKQAYLKDFFQIDDSRKFDPSKPRTRRPQLAQQLGIRPQYLDNFWLNVMIPNITQFFQQNPSYKDVATKLLREMKEKSRMQKIAGIK